MRARRHRRRLLRLRALLIERAQLGEPLRLLLLLAKLALRDTRGLRVRHLRRHHFGLEELRRGEVAVEEAVNDVLPLGRGGRERVERLHRVELELVDRGLGEDLHAARGGEVEQVLAQLLRGHFLAQRRQRRLRRRGSKRRHGALVLIDDHLREGLLARIASARRRAVHEHLVDGILSDSQHCLARWRDGSHFLPRVGQA